MYIVYLLTLRKLCVIFPFDPWLVVLICVLVLVYLWEDVQSNLKQKVIVQLKVARICCKKINEFVCFRITMKGRELILHLVVICKKFKHVRLVYLLPVGLTLPRGTSFRLSTSEYISTYSKMKHPDTSN